MVVNIRRVTYQSDVSNSRFIDLNLSKRLEKGFKEKTSALKGVDLGKWRSD